MWTSGVLNRRVALVALLLVALAPTIEAAEQGQYRSRVQINPPGQTEQGRVLSVEELERQIGTIDDPYAKSSAGRHLARHYVEQKEYDKAVEYYRTALGARGLSDVANREMLRELAQVYLLKEDYAMAASTLERALAIDLVPVAGDFLLLARAHYLRRDYVGVVAALDRIDERGLVLDLPETRQALALYYRAGAWAQCETLLKRLLEQEPGNPEHWHQLAAVYLQQNKKRQALDQLSLAREKGVPFREADLSLLVDLMVVNGNPYGAAETLRDALAAGEITANGVNYRKLFELWFQAREQQQAATALATAARLTGDTELYLYLAQLQMEQEDWQGMYRTMQSACAEQLADRYVGRANLFLGVSQLKLGDEAAARRSFINATLIGGANMQAGQWLEFMAAAPASEDEMRRIEGLCVGSEGKQRELASLQTSSAGTPRGGQVDTAAETEFQFRDLPAQRLFYTTLDSPLDEVGPNLKGMGITMSVRLVKSGGAADGPLQLIWPAGEGDTVQFAVPARGSPRAGGKYRVRRAEPMKAAYRMARGSGEELAATWRQFAASLQDAGYQLTGERRAVFSSAPGEDSGGLEVELQLGVVE
jgi:tetratricopeptide (TPR) repeat protein